MNGLTNCRKRVLSFLLSFVMVITMVPITPLTAFAVGTDNLCEHHTEHTADCGYAAAVEGAECAHVHDEICGFAEAVEEVPCSCTETDEAGAIVHIEGCGYVASVEGSECTHTHDETCGYVAAVEGHECHYECAECAIAPTNENPGDETPVCTCEAAEGEAHTEGCALYVAPADPTCSCTVKCGETANPDCTVCTANPSTCTGTESSESDAKVLTTVDGVLYIDGVEAPNSNDEIKLPAGHYKLEGDIAPSYWVRVEGEGDTVLDLNGYTLDLGYRYVIVNSPFSVYDTSEANAGKITSSSTGYTILLNKTTALFNLYSGTIENTSDESESYAVLASRCGANLYGGKLISNGYAIGYKMYNAVALNLDDVELVSGTDYDEIWVDYNVNYEIVGVVDVADYTGAALSVHVDNSGVTGKLKIFEGIESAEDAERYTVRKVTCAEEYDCFFTGAEYDATESVLYINFAVNTFTQQPTVGNGLTAVFSNPTADLQWYEVEETLLTNENTTAIGSYNSSTGKWTANPETYALFTVNVNAGDVFRVSIDSVESYAEIYFGDSFELYVELDNDNRSGILVMPEDGTITVYSYHDVALSLIRGTLLNGETGNSLQSHDSCKTYWCKATVNGKVYVSDAVVAHDYTYTDNQDGTHTRVCSGCEEIEVHTTITEATCSGKAVCADCGEYGGINEYNHAKPYTADFQWPETPEEDMYVRVDLYCVCGEPISQWNSAEVTLTETVVPDNCVNPGSSTYTATYEKDGETYTETKTYPVKSDNHTALDDYGFCACGGYEKPDYDEENNLYSIENAGQLYWYAEELNTNNTEVYAKLVADIVIPATAPNWVPISASYVYFDGNFHTISGMKCIGGADDAYVGMFGDEVWWYDISNLHITDSYFEGTQFVGALVAQFDNGGSVTNCYVTSTTVKGGEEAKVGALVGYLGNSQIVNCYTDAAPLVGHDDSQGSRVINSYYLSDAETDDGGKTARQFASGEIAYLLQSGQELGSEWDEELQEWVDTPAPHVWGQTAGEGMPTFGGKKVYYGHVDCDDEEMIYTNDSTASDIKPSHNFNSTNGMCEACGNFVAAASVTIGGATVYYEIMDEAVQAVKDCTKEDNAVVKIEKDMNAFIDVYSGVFTFDLNGHTITSSHLGTLNLKGSSVDVTIVDSGEGGSIEGQNGVRIEDGAVLTIEGGTVSGTTYAVYLNSSTLTVTGGTIDSPVDIKDSTDGSTSTCKLTLAEGKTEGATFPGGLTVEGTTPDAILGEGMGYWQGEKMIVPGEGQTEITGGDVVIKPECKHENAAYLAERITETHHTFVCPCGYEVTEEHSLNAEGDRTASCSGDAWCTVCRIAYQEKNPDIHDSSIEYNNGFCENGCLEPAFLNADGCYEIKNAGQLFWFAKQINGGSITKFSAILTDDITIPDDKVWTSINLPDGEGNSSTFDGGGYSITFNQSAGLFTRINYSTVKNLTLYGSVTGTGSHVGAVSHSSYRTTFENIISYVDVTNASGTAGGLVGQFGGKHENGLESKIINCAVYADVSGTNAGGLVGWGWSGTQYFNVENSAYVGTVSGTNASGAIIGYFNTTTAGTNTVLKNLYYCAGGVGAVGVNDDHAKMTKTNVESKTAEQFANGEIAWLLNGESSDGVWKQNVGIDPYPGFTGNPVIKSDSEDAPFYYNDGMVCVNISWTEMSFTYTPGEWNPETHTYDGGSWTADDENSGQITVKNVGGSNVAVGFSFRGTMGSVSGSFTVDKAALATGRSVATTLTVGGSPNQSGFVDAEIGTVTVTLGSSGWAVGDKVTMYAKDGSVQSCVVNEITNTKAVLRSESYKSAQREAYYSTTAYYTTKLAEPLGARFPTYAEAKSVGSYIYETLISVMATGGGSYYNTDDLTLCSNRTYPLYKDDDNNFIQVSNSNSSMTMFYFLMWDIPFAN